MAVLYKVSLCVNTLVLLFSASMVISSSIYISRYSNSDFLFSVVDFILILITGIIGMTIALFGCWGAKDPVGKYNLLFCYFFFLSMKLLLFGFAFYLYRIFVLDLTASSDGDIEDAFRAESAKEFNDFILSLYTICCTGCIENEAGCAGNFAPLFDPNPCPGNSTCALADICSSEQRNRDSGLGQGCIINSQVNPSYSFGDNACIFFANFATDDDGIFIVGEAQERSCGAGNPAVFTDQVSEFVGKNYYLIISFWGLGLVFLLIAWLGSFSMLLCPHRYEKIPK